MANRPLVLKKWHPNFDLLKEDLRSVPLWVKLHGVPLEYWTPVGLSHIASAVGKPLHTDKLTASKKRISFARICVEVEASKELPKDFYIQCEVTGSLFLWSMTGSLKYVLTAKSLDTPMPNVLCLNQAQNQLTRILKVMARMNGWRSGPRKKGKQERGPATFSLLRKVVRIGRPARNLLALPRKILFKILLLKLVRDNSRVPLRLKGPSTRPARIILPKMALILFQGILLWCRQIVWLPPFVSKPGATLTR